MREGIRLGNWFGVPISADYSWLAIAGFVTVALAQGFGDVASGWLLWVASFLASVLFFLSVIVHELGHSLVAIRRGIPVRRIRLFILGGVSELEHEAHNPNDELAVTLAGPLLSVLLGVSFLIPGLILGSDLVGRALTWLGAVNLILGVFNLLPGFPLDGGRALRALVWKSTGNRVHATKLAARSGQVLALLVMGAGFALTTTSFGFDGLWMAMIGWFLYTTAKTVGSMPGVDPRLLDRRLEVVMTRTTRYLGPAAPLTALTPDLGRWVPVLDPWGLPLGVVDSDKLRRIPIDRWTSTKVGDVMQPCSAVASVDDRVGEMLEKVRSSNWVVLVMEHGAPVGVVDAQGLGASVDELWEDYSSSVDE